MNLTMIPPELLTPEQAAQIEWERASVERGVARYRASLTKTDRKTGDTEAVPLADLKPGKDIIADVMRPMVRLLEERQREAAEDIHRRCAGGRAAYGPVAVWAWPILQLPADKLAFITLRTVLTFNTRQTDWVRPVSAMSRTVSQHVREEIEFEEWKRAENAAKKADPDRPNWWALMRKWAPAIDLRAFKKFRAVQEKHTGPGFRADWTDSQRLQLGAVLLEALVIEGKGWFVAERVRTSKYQQGAGILVVGLTAAALEWVASKHSEYELTRPWLLPMKCEPFEWGWQDGETVVGQRDARTSVSVPGTA